MPDITMCKAILPDGSFCKDKDSCYRYLAEPSLLWQSYAQCLRESSDAQCEYHIDYVTGIKAEAEP